MQPSNTFIVCSKHNKDTSWTTKLTERGFHIAVYNHDNDGRDGYCIPKNKGREASVYLKYIIDHYNSLFPYTIFLHDEEYAWHHDGSIVNLVINTKPKQYTSLNKLCMYSIKGNDKIPIMKAFFKKYLEPYIGSIDKFGDWTVGEKCCAQFVVHRNRIHRYPLEFYQNIYNWLMTTNIDERTSGNMLEWTWSLLFNNPLKDQNLNSLTHAKRQENRLKEKKPKCKFV
jgi:hypothetical protein